MATARRGAKAKDKPRKRASPRKLLKKLPTKKSSKAAARRVQAHPAGIETALAIFAHEVRTPLTGILAVSDLLITSGLGERERQWAETIKAGAEHLAALATLFVDAARDGAAPNSSSGLREEFFDLRALMRIAGESLTGRATARGLRSAVTLPDDLPRFVIGDSVRLRAALENLIDNAVKFTESGSVSLDASAKRLRGRSVVLRFAIADSGIGLSLAEIKRLFKPFSQANVTIAARFGGAGLGLSSVRQIARAMGGDVTAASLKHGGTAFTLTVKLQEADAPARGGTDRSVAGASGLRILSVEDNPFGRVVLNAILTELGHACEFIGSGEAAIDRVTRGSFDVVLMDMVLPGIDGIETIRRLRQQKNDQPRVAIIGLSGRDGDRRAALAAGADSFLVKPVSPRLLAQALASALHRESRASS